MEALEKVKLALRKYLSENRDKVIKDLDNERKRKNKMYLFKFDSLGILVKESAKLARRVNLLKHEIYVFEDDEHYKKMSAKSPLANCKRIDYFGKRKMDGVPRYIIDYVMDIEEVQQAMTAKIRDRKIDQILGDDNIFIISNLTRSL